MRRLRQMRASTWFPDQNGPDEVNRPVHHLADEPEPRRATPCSAAKLLKPNHASTRGRLIGMSTSAHS